MGVDGEIAKVIPSTSNCPIQLELSWIDLDFPWQNKPVVHDRKYYFVTLSFKKYEIKGIGKRIFDKLLSPKEYNFVVRN